MFFFLNIFIGVNGSTNFYPPHGLAKLFVCMCFLVLKYRMQCYYIFNLGSEVGLQYFFLLNIQKTLGSRQIIRVGRVTATPSFFCLGLSKMEQGCNVWCQMISGRRRFRRIRTI